MHVQTVGRCLILQCKFCMQSTQTCKRLKVSSVNGRGEYTHEIRTSVTSCLLDVKNAFLHEGQRQLLHHASADEGSCTRIHPAVQQATPWRHHAGHTSVARWTQSQPEAAQSRAVVVVSVQPCKEAMNSQHETRGTISGQDCIGVDANKLCLT